MREGTRRTLIFSALVALIVSVLGADPNAKGPLAYAVEYWLSEQDERANVEFEHAATILAELGIDPRFLALPTVVDVAAVAPLDGEIDLDALRVALDRCCRDERSSSLITALVLARRGERQHASQVLARISEERASRRLKDLAALVARR